jgi:cytochrome c oxidase subunit 1
MPRIRSESPAFDMNHPEAEFSVGVGPLADMAEMR